MGEYPDKDMEKLSRAIVEAILGSKDVKEALEKLKKVDDQAAKNLMVFILRLDSLNELKDADLASLQEQAMQEAMDEQEFDEPRPRLKRIRRKTEPLEKVDGKPITKNEKKFLDYLSEQFDEDNWLKENGLKLED